ncbi:tRNA preQ1(34) S-adenosylmethionine ribosyltransferase-isomerase QueA [Bacteroidales bacterium OttesenSCG-928-B11]|nr:tRNA preQ1(34) S-adenosylmethionine ribosyltransferase-isomerase QueA [Bacteroidales bacterium OttesenSCG-928-E04]MDL2312493.1 tRNA preQ1(34) S-adenosylmethionine ribosyltransferase-isomerase QueA [Bacteroidales bacterium OttesenSCG-928-B11]MDL2325724.1 tRNA preQ1(34) S-adenosylmethionine ribosyltransferase-isomerase QueA [Bacteroidales bacterium OttesenSCG-928-A14]
MKLSQFKYFLPEERIALHPAGERDESKLMVLNRKTQTIEHKIFKDVIDYFDEGDLLVMNNTKVFPALLFGEKEKTGAKIRVFLLRELDEESRLWDVLVDPARKIRIGNKLYFGDDDSLVAEVIDNTTSRGRTLRFLFDGDHDAFKLKLREYGYTPLPEDIQRLREITPEDEENYQTIYAKHEGAVAAPASGFHFSRELIKKLELKGIDFAEVTLHAGLGNFRDIDVEDLTKHKTDSEQMIITEEAAQKINEVKDAKHKVCIVGTTAMKAIESSVYTSGRVKPYEGWTNKFIFPQYQFMVGDAMISNFHAPQSPMLMMVAAFGGYDFVMKAYKEAIDGNYRFLTYGDAMLII